MSNYNRSEDNYDLHFEGRLNTLNTLNALNALNALDLQSTFSRIVLNIFNVLKFLIIAFTHSLLSHKNSIRPLKKAIAHIVIPYGS